MEILYILDYTPLGTRAFDQFLLALFKKSSLSGMTLRFVFAAPPAPAFLDATIAAGVDVSWCVIEFPLRWRFWMQIQKRWPGYKPDLVYTSFLSVFTWPMLFARMTHRFRFWVVSDESSGAVSESCAAKRALRWLRGHLFGRWVHAVRTVSEFIAQRDVRDMFLPVERVHAIWNGIDLDKFPMLARTPNGDEAVRILYIGQLIPEKGVSTLLHAMAGLSQAGYRFHCRIAGAGADKATLVTEMQQLALGSAVEFVGYCSTPLLQYHWADIVVVPSVWAEAFGLVVIEAMATGAVVVVSDAGGLPEVVADAGIVFPAGNPECLRAELEKLAKDDGCREILSDKGRIRVENFFQLETAVGKIVDLWSDAGAG